MISLKGAGRPMWNCTYTQVSVVFVGQHCSLSHFPFSALGLVALGAESEPAKNYKVFRVSHGYHIHVHYVSNRRLVDDYRIGCFFSAS